MKVISILAKKYLSSWFHTTSEYSIFQIVDAATMHSFVSSCLFKLLFSKGLTWDIYIPYARFKPIKIAKINAPFLFLQKLSIIKISLLSTYIKLYILSNFFLVFINSQRAPNLSANYSYAIIFSSLVKNSIRNEIDRKIVVWKIQNNEKISPKISPLTYVSRV